MKFQYYFLILVFLFSINAGKGQDNRRRNWRPQSNVFIISIGINKYPKPFNSLYNCVNDSEALVDKIISDNSNFNSHIFENEIALKNIEKPISSTVGSIYSFLLHDEKATLENIKIVFKKVANLASSNDSFIFNFAGASSKISLIPFHLETLKTLENVRTHYDAYVVLEENPSPEMLSLEELAKLMEQIPCKDQLVISEAGLGSAFAQNLISELFESNPLIAAGTERNRIIFTTRGHGLDGYDCGDKWINHGPLMHYILSNDYNVLDVFSDFDKYEFQLIKAEVNCPVRSNDSRYFVIYKEKDFRNVLIHNYQKTISRGLKPTNSKNSSRESKIYSLIIATNEYNAQSSWRTLKNPQNDAEKISSILKDRYNSEVRILYDKPKDSILLEILNIKNTITEKDKFIFFIAGHGYFSEAFSDGYLVFTDSKSIKEDITLESYLQMASLNRLLDNMPSKNVFAIFDVCFGSSFDLNSRNLSLSDYRDILMDIEVDEFDQRKSQYNSRIFLASGKYEVPDYWFTSGQHSPFAEKLINSLNKEESFITPGKLFSNLAGNITEPILKQFGKHDPRADFVIQVK